MVVEALSRFSFSAATYFLESLPITTKIYLVINMQRNERVLLMSNKHPYSFVHICSQTEILLEADKDEQNSTGNVYSETSIQNKKACSHLNSD